MKNYAYPKCVEGYIYRCKNIGVKDESLFIITRKLHSKASKDAISHWESAPTMKAPKTGTPVNITDENGNWSSSSVFYN